MPKIKKISRIEIGGENMGYFDYVDNGKLKEQKEIKFMEEYAHKAMLVSIAGGSCVVLSIILLVFLDICTFWWLGFINIGGIVSAIIGLIINNKTLSVARKQKIKSPLANLAQALHIFLFMLNATIFALCIIYGFFM